MYLEAVCLLNNVAQRLSVLSVLLSVLSVLLSVLSVLSVLLSVLLPQPIHSQVATTHTNTLQSHTANTHYLS